MVEKYNLDMVYFTYRSHPFSHFQPESSWEVGVSKCHCKGKLLEDQEKYLFLSTWKIFLDLITTILNQIDLIFAIQLLVSRRSFLKVGAMTKPQISDCLAFFWTKWHPRIRLFEHSTKPVFLISNKFAIIGYLLVARNSQHRLFHNVKFTNYK